MSTILMLASFGLEIVECGGALAAHVEHGDRVIAAVTFSRPEARPQICKAAEILGIHEVEFLDIKVGDWELNATTRMKIVALIRRLRPDIVILQDPEHAQHDLDPDRRMLALLYSESFAISGRDWRVEECGGYKPFMPRSFYYMSPEHPNCIVEISKYYARKINALAVLESQLTFTAEHFKERTSDDLLRHLVADYDVVKEDLFKLGHALSDQFFLATALWNGAAGHSGAVLGEAYRHEGPFVIERLLY